MVHVENLGNGLHRLIYISRINGVVAPDLVVEMEEIVDISNRNNTALGVTGLLLTHDGFFVQALEGSHETISALLGEIAQDPRHTDLKVVSTELISARAFGRWSMRAGRRLVNNASEGFDPYSMSPKDLAALLSLSAVLGGGAKRRAA